MAKLRIAFIGKDYFFNRTLCRWLAGHADLRLIVWTDRIAWPHRRGFFWAWARIARRILSRGRNGGPWRAIDEFAFYVLYVLFLRRREEERSRRLVESVRVHEAIDHVRQESPTRIDDPRLLAMLESLRLDAVFAMCVDSYFPRRLRDAPRHGVFLWHEGITPEYRGLYSNLWALMRQDSARIGYTLLKMNERFDAGPIYLQGAVEDADFERDWPTYLGHKSVVDSLPRVEGFLRDLERNAHRPTRREGARDAYYSYPTASGLIRLAARRLIRRVRILALSDRREPFDEAG